MLWFYDLKRGGVILLVALNLVLLTWALLVYRRRGALPDGYYRLLPLSPVVAAIQLTLGVTVFARGMRPDVMHIFYGVLVGTGALLQGLLGRRTALGHRYRARPLIHLVLALFVALLSARSWMAVR